MKKECKYRMPCGRCDKFDSFCDMNIGTITGTHTDVFVVMRTVDNSGLKQNDVVSVHMTENAALYRKLVEEERAKSNGFDMVFRIDHWRALD